MLVASGEARGRLDGLVQQDPSFAPVRAGRADMIQSRCDLVDTLLFRYKSFICLSRARSNSLLQTVLSASLRCFCVLHQDESHQESLYL